MLSHLYSNNINNQRIVILGPLPPPLGGISVHIKRVAQKFINQNNRVFHFDTIHCLWRYPLCLVYLFIFLVIKRPHLVYYHTLYGHGLIELKIITYAKKIGQFKLVLVDHDCRYLSTKSKQFKQSYNDILKTNIDHLVLIGNSTVESYYGNGITLSNYSIESPFLPPYLPDEQTILKTYPPTLFEFLANYRLILAMNAFRMSLINNKDLYGIDMALQALSVIQKQYFSVGLVIVLGEIYDQNYYQKMQQFILQNNLQNNCFFLVGQKELWPLLRRVHCFVRPTLSDSFGISAAESLYFNVPTIASDCCTRAPGAILFKTGDQADFIQKIRSVLDSMSLRASK